MADLQLTRIALIGARMDAFAELGYSSRHQIAMRRIAPPDEEGDYAGMAPASLRRTLAARLPLWVHNIITDPEFPRRPRLIMPLRRFEGELADRRDDEVISTVLAHGFNDRPFDPLRLPPDMGTRERCAIVAHLGAWQEAFQVLESSLLDILCEEPALLDRWVSEARTAETDPVE